MNREGLLRRLLAAEGGPDAAVERIGEADYGCEERPEGEETRAWVLLLLRGGAERALEVPESRLTALGLAEGSLCRLADLTGDA